MPYTGTFQLAAADYQEGFSVYSNAVSNVPQINQSGVAQARVVTFDPNATYDVELEFTATSLNLNVDDSFNIRDYVRVKGDPTAFPEWDEIYFTYTSAGANSPTSPPDWHLGSFNTGATVTVQSGDLAPGTGNAGDGTYMVYLVRNGQAAYDDSMSIKISDGSGNPGSQLMPPDFLPTGGYFESSSFPMLVTLSDPNPPGTGKIMFTVDGTTQEYSAPFSVQPDTQVDAYVASLDPTTYQDSYTRTENYNPSSPPWGPWVWVSMPEIDAVSGSTDIYIGFHNTSHLSYEIQYKLIPTVTGSGGGNAMNQLHWRFQCRRASIPGRF